jgi:hypothetical protein
MPKVGTGVAGTTLEGCLTRWCRAYHFVENYLGLPEGLSGQKQAASPAFCQMIIAVGQPATAAQAIDHDLLDESLRSRSLPRIGRTGEVQGAMN